MTALQDEHQQWENESTGALVNNGFIFIGDYGLDPVANPQTIFSDPELQVSIAQQRTGPDGRAVNKIYVDGLYSIRVDDENSVQLYQELLAGQEAQTGASSLSNVSGTNTITADGTPTITALVDKQIFSFIAAGAPTGAVTLQIDATAVRAIVKYHDQPIIDGDWEANQAISVIVNNTDSTYELISPTLNPQIQSITATVASSALTLGLNPTSQYFRRTPLTDGLPNVRSNAALSLVVPSGATLGTTNAVESRITILAIDNAGTVELACINALTTSLDETGLITTLVIGTGSDSADVFYSTSARSSVPYRVVGFEDSTQSTAGTWDTAPTLIQGAGGNSLEAINTKQGDFSVTITSGTSTITINTSFDTLAYTKVGRVCHVQGTIAVLSVGTPTGALTIVGLPFAAATLTELADSTRFAVWGDTFSAAADGFKTGQILFTSTSITIFDTDGTAFASEIIAGSTFYFNFSYITA